jgi:hypothetical protein
MSGGLLTCVYSETVMCIFLLLSMISIRSLIHLAAFGERGLWRFRYGIS